MRKTGERTTHTAAEWACDGTARPSFAVEPGPGQESVWDYPRPPRIETDRRHVVVRFADTLVADTHQAVRVLETASPPTFYLPPRSVNMAVLRPAAGSSFCEWKGEASYYSLQLGGQTIEHVAWCYRQPLAPFAAIKDYLSFYPAKLACYVDEERVQAQAGGFYGGWITSEIVGPFKGEAGSKAW